MTKVKFYGVRGSIATAGDETRRYGGNTSCVMVDVGGPALVFDAGTGIRKLGNELLQQASSSGNACGIDVHLFLSHLHWDHIQGFPFFAPAFIPGNRLHVYGVRSPIDVEGSATTQELNLATLEEQNRSPHGSSVRAALAAQMTPPNFPVGLEAMRATLELLDVPYGDRLKVGPAVVRHVGVDHPNGCVAWRVDHEGKSVVYATDLELAEGVGGAVFDALVDLARGCDLLIFDAMYTPEEYEGKGTFSRRGWGHSTFEMGAAVAEACHAARLCLFHHDPAHDDAFMDELTARAQRRFSSTITAREGMEVTL